MPFGHRCSPRTQAATKLTVEHVDEALLPSIDLGTRAKPAGQSCRETAATDLCHSCKLELGSPAAFSKDEPGIKALTEMAGGPHSKRSRHSCREREALCVWSTVRICNFLLLCHVLVPLLLVVLHAHQSSIPYLRQELLGLAKVARRATARALSEALVGEQR